MRTRYRISIGGTQLDACLDNNSTYKKYKDSIVITNISYSAPEFSRTIETAGDGDGGIITKTYRQKASVTVTFCLRIYNVADRFAVCQIIKGMCQKGGTISTNDRTGQILQNCVCEKFPEIESARDWAEPLTMTFSSYSFPYWRDSTEKTYKTLKGKSTSASATIPGNAPVTNCIVRMTANENFAKTSSKSASVTIGTTVKLGVNGTYINLAYEFKKNNYVVIDYTSNNILRIRLYETKSATKSTSLLEYVMPNSDDKLLATPGASNKFEIDALKSITAEFALRGAWL